MTQPRREAVAEVYNRKVTRDVQHAYEVKPTAIVMPSGSKASVVVGLRLFRRIYAQCFQQRNELLRKNLRPCCDKISTAIAATSRCATLGRACVSCLRDLLITIKAPLSKLTHLET